MRLPIGRATRAVWARRIKGFWFEYSHNRIGLVGMGILFFFIATAIFAPFIAPYSMETVHLESPRQADKYALPEWTGIFGPQFRDLPLHTVHPLNWATEQQLPSSVELEKTATSTTIHYNASKSGSSEPVTISFNSSFNYPYAPMRLFSFSFTWKGVPDNVTTVYKDTPIGRLKAGETGTMDYMLQLDMITPNGTSWPIWDQNWDSRKAEILIIPQPAFWSSNSTGLVFIYSDLGPLAAKLGYEFHEPVKMIKDVFESKGLYTLQFRVTVRPGTYKEVEVPLNEAAGLVRITNGEFTVWGRRWGLMGTDGMGHDVFSQLVHGCRISILIGVSAAVTSTLIGLLVGVTAGYVGGWTDESLMRIVDILLCLPILPMLLVFIAIFGYSTWFVVIIIAIFGWQGLSRVIRSQALSVRETTFIESAVASGGSSGYVITRHIVPNVLPTALTSLVLSVPGAIILEAALSFLGLGDPHSPTWGKILHYAQITGAFSPTHAAWWDVVPPGLAITFLCLGFVFLGHAVDEIVNPRLRRRR